MLKMKKVVWLALFGMGMGVGASAFAMPTAATCALWFNECRAGDEGACFRLETFCEIRYEED